MRRHLPHSHNIGDSDFLSAAIENSARVAPCLKADLVALERRVLLREVRDVAGQRHDPVVHEGGHVGRIEGRVEFKFVDDGLPD